MIPIVIQRYIKALLHNINVIFFTLGFNSLCVLLFCLNIVCVVPSTFLFFVTNSLFVQLHLHSYISSHWVPTIVWQWNLMGNFFFLWASYFKKIIRSRDLRSYVDGNAPKPTEGSTSKWVIIWSIMKKIKTSIMESVDNSIVVNSAHSILLRLNGLISKEFISKATSRKCINSSNRQIPHL